LDTLRIRAAHPEFLASPTPDISEDDLNPVHFISLDGGPEEPIFWDVSDHCQLLREWYAVHDIPENAHIRVNGKRVFDGDPEQNDHIEVWTGPRFQIRYKRKDHNMVLRPTSPWEDLLEWIQISGGNTEELRIRKDIFTIASEEDLHPDIRFFIGKIPQPAAKWKFEERDIPPQMIDAETKDMIILDKWGRHLYNYFTVWNVRYQKKATKTTAENEIRTAADRFKDTVEYIDQQLMYREMAEE
jgi:hypothetical protein